MARNRTAEEAWEALARAQTALMRGFQEDFRGEEVSMRVYDVLYTLSRCPSGARLRDLNAHILLTQPSLSRLVERMEADGLVHRCGDPTDRRATVVRLTERGREIQRRVGRRHAAAIADRVGGALSEEELATLRALADKLRAAQEGRGSVSMTVDP